MKDIRILLCEDDPSLGKLLTDYLRAKGFVATWERLVKSIKAGSMGKWGPIPMPPNAVTDDEAKQLAEWIMSL